MQEWKKPSLTNLGVEATKEENKEDKGLIRCQCCGMEFGSMTNPDNVAALQEHRQTFHGSNIGDPCPIS